MGSWLNKIVEPDSRCRSTSLSRWMAPVKNWPAGTITWPPPARLQAAMAAANAWVQSVTPSPTAPNWVTGKNRPGKKGPPHRGHDAVRSPVRGVEPAPPGGGRVSR